MGTAFKSGITLKSLSQAVDKSRGLRERQAKKRPPKGPREAQEMSLDAEASEPRCDLERHAWSACDRLDLNTETLAG